MTGDLFINGKDAWSTWGVRMGDSFLDAIDGFNEMKDYIENESRLEHGKRVITDNAKVDSREITLQFTIEGSSESDYRSKKKAFQTELEKGAVNIKVPVLGNEVYKLVYLGKSVSYGLSLDRCFGKVSSKFEEPNPMDRNE
ncbi:hypothetical protein [uncultured Bacteroides sp.]|jgi:hypothetical protein|uniref:hypothetical protein n=1 Tax=uncultured Bacteroides sp. TaxID=162156 RepID=UPI00280B1EAB|nr:hypothetical protein [uncultured Bacteroides sp.]